MKKIRTLYHQLLSGDKPDLVLWLFPIVGLLLLCLLPLMLTQSGWGMFDFSKTGEIGDTIGGISGPFIAFIAAMLTFLAFWIQVKANKVQTEQFGKQDSDTKIDRFENKFYELIKLHKANVSEVFIDDDVNNRLAFKSIFEEYKICYYTLASVIKRKRKNLTLKKELSLNDLVKISYVVFFIGIEKGTDEITKELLKDYDEDLKSEYISELKMLSGSRHFGFPDLSEFNLPKFIVTVEHKLFRGYSSMLGHYYRHLFQIVKFVVNQDPKMALDKYEYLKTLRAQLSDYEQLLLYYNGLTPFGKSWILNNYFTDFRMIKNLPLPLAVLGPRPKDVLGEKNSLGKFLFEWDERIYS